MGGGDIRPVGNKHKNAIKHSQTETQTQKCVGVIHNRLWLLPLLVNEKMSGTACQIAGNKLI